MTGKKMKIEAKYAPSLQTCCWGTCSRWVAVVAPNWSKNAAWNPTHEAPINAKALTLKKVKEFLSEKAISQLVKEGKKVIEIEWGIPDCYCVYADDCSVLYVTIDY